MIDPTYKTKLTDDKAIAAINIKIAKYMGLIELKTPYSGSVMLPSIDKKDNRFFSFIESLLRPEEWYIYPEFDKNYQWLMLVVEKINKRDKVTIYSDECKIHAMIPDQFKPIDIIVEGEPAICSIFLAVDAYIDAVEKNYK